MNHLIYIALLLLLHGCAVSQTSAQTIPASELRELARKSMMPVVYNVPESNRVQIVENLKYTPTDDPNIAMDIYRPPEHASSEKLPAVIFIHGGARAEWTPKDWGIYKSWGRLIAASGLVAVTFTHRLEYPNKTLDAGARDVQAAINYVRSNADKYNVDKDRICLIAFSAGGPMLSLALRGETPYVKCVVGFYAFMDIRQSNYNKAEDAEKLKAFSSITYLEKDPRSLPAIFIARAGLEDVPTMNDSIDRFVSTAISKNIALTFANHPSGVHGFDSQNNDDRSREIIANAIAFMRSNLGMKKDIQTNNMTKEMSLTRVFDAPVSEVWKYWTEGDKLMKWWGPKGFTSPIARMDVREGSASFVCMRPPPEYGGQDMCNTWAYKKIVPEKEIEFVMTFANMDGKELDPRTLGLPVGMPREVRHVITFRDLGGKTELTVTEFGYTSEEVVEISRVGLGQCLDKMKESLNK
jgi:acetyl esterase/lipase/uncharacterized protein YndB with AHSA1/START domain